jgi:hypothetical protein
MTGLALLLALAAQAPLGAFTPGLRATGTGYLGTGGRVYTSRAIHVGVRPAAYLDNEGSRARLERAAGVTVQITAAVL